jgi:DNA polymerase-1
MATDIAVYAEGRMMPPVEDLLVAVLRGRKDIGEVHTWDQATDRLLPCLVLGNMPEITPGHFVKTLSQKQILSNPAALTELGVAIDNLLTPPTFPKMEYRVVDTELSFLEERTLGDVLVVDIETTNYGNPNALNTEVGLLCIGINDGKNIYIFSEKALKAPRVIEQLIRIFRKKKRKLIAHNMKFDFPTIGHIFGIELYGHLDTMLLHHSINHGAKEHGLKALCRKYLGAPDWEGDIKKHLKGSKGGDYAAIPRAVLYQYNAYDVYWTWYLYEYLVAIANAEPRIKDVALHEFRASAYLFQDVEYTGAGVDVPYLAKLKAEYDEEEAPLLKEIKELADNPDFNPGSWQQVKKYLLEWGLEPKTTGEADLLDLPLKEGTEPHRFRELLLDIRGIRKNRDTYVVGVQKRMRGNVVHPTFNIHGTSTGRLSASDPNIQNIPRDKKLRKIFVPRAPGRTMVQVDYSQAELRVMAALSGDKHLISLFQKGSSDFFDAMIPGAFPERFPTLEEYLQYEAEECNGDEKDYRAQLKGVVYGLAYNRQAPAIAAELGLTVKQAQSIITNFLNAAPEFKKWRKEVQEIVLDPERTLISPFGRQYQAEVITPKNKQNVLNSGLAFLPQSTASDLCVIAAINAHGRLKSGQYGDTMIVATIHDAILLDVPDEYVDSVAAMVMEEMEKSGTEKFGDVLHFGADASTGRSWGEAA